jgi:hypothetical protein
MLDSWLNLANKLLYLAGYGAIFLIIWLFKDHFVRWITKLGEFADDIFNTEMFKQQKAYTIKNAIPTLHLQAAEAQKAADAAQQKVTEVDAARGNALTEASTNEAESKRQANLIVQINDRIKNDLQPKLDKYNKIGDTINANKVKRTIDDELANATFAESEKQTAIDSAKLYAQWANQVAKMGEILRDNAAGAARMVRGINSTIRVIEKRLQTTNTINAATQSISAAFQIKDSWKFQVAMDAVNSAINYNIAQIHTNIAFADQHRDTAGGSMSADTLNKLASGLKNDGMKSLNLIEISDASHDLTKDEIVDASMNIL